MIRPVTCVCFLMACGAGLYLYQAKHRVSLIDQQIERTVRATGSVHERIRLLHEQWTRLSQPDRLQALASQFLSLKPTSPSQFTSMAELDGRLPPLPPPLPEPSLSPPPTLAVAPAMPDEPPPQIAEPAPTRTQTEATPPRHDAGDHAAAVTAKPTPRGPTTDIAAAPSSRQTPPARAHPIIAQTGARPVWPPRRPVSIAQAEASQPAMPPGSLLGMAHMPASRPAPAPMPIDEISRAHGN